MERIMFHILMPRSNQLLIVRQVDVDDARKTTQIKQTIVMMVQKGQIMVA
jgi:hypothetical protein